MPDTTTRSVTAKIRFPREVLATFDQWAATHDMPRSVAVRVLALRGLAFTGHAGYAEPVDPIFVGAQILCELPGGCTVVKLVDEPESQPEACQ
jgi:hypothetical protein